MPTGQQLWPSGALVISPDIRLRAELCGCLSEISPAIPVSHQYELRESPGRASICFLDITADPERSLADLARLAASSPGIPIVAVAEARSPDLILRALRSGAAEFLLRPFSPGDIAPLLDKLARAPATRGTQDSPPPGRLICIAPGKAGSGATALAINLAFALKSMPAGRILLADLDGLAGTVGFVLKLNSTYSFLDALEHAEALDTEMWKGLAAHSNGLDIMLAPENPTDCSHLRLDPSPVLAAARQAYDTVLVDAGGITGPWDTAIARLCDELYIVTTAELLSVQSTRAGLRSLSENGIGIEKVRLVLNRHSARDPQRREMIEATLGARIAAVLPPDFDELDRALLEGRPAAASSAFGKAVSHLARASSFAGNRPRAQARKSVLGRILAAIGVSSKHAICG